MASPIELLREVMTLTSNVTDLKEQVSRLEQRVASNTERIVRLEAREEVLLEKAKNAYLTVASQFHGRMVERLVNVERTQGLSAPAPPLLDDGS